MSYDATQVQWDAPVPSAVMRFQTPALIVGVLGVVAAVVAAVLDFRQFLHAYLFAFTFWNGVTLGAMALLMIQYLTGGGWGILGRRTMEAAVRNMWLMALFFLPILAGVLLNKLYIWTDTARVEADHHLHHKATYLNVPFFLGRLAFYFTVWIVWAHFLSRWSLQQDQSGDKKLAQKLRNLSGPGLLVMAITMTFSNIDWLMSLEPYWFSSMYPLINMVGNLLSAVCFTVAVVTLMADNAPFKGLISSKHFRDFGNLMLAFTMLWTYTSLSQFLITYSGNLPEETPWYLNRLNGGWGYVAASLLVGHFMLPFAVLLQRQVKDPGKPLIYVGAFIIFMRMVDLFWWIKPAYDAGHGFHAVEHLSHFSLSWMDVAAPLAIGGVWVWFYLRNLQQRPLLPRHDPRLTEAFAHGGH
ncbi:MAG: hypothetical protein NZ585_04690 [Chloracidobacterium sp.]|nr:hypothetical protein [Chloracidobacterium sp.]MDW8218650.1 hypothetical protein [Acidobacteriota bacterium]